MRRAKSKRIKSFDLVMTDNIKSLYSCLLACGHKKLMVVGVGDGLPNTTICDLCTEYWSGYEDWSGMR